ncbi:sodium ion-translocating decarboxylase subunit beta [Clostridia bacterium OttesenSCG-928-O13]|nr:sodium ion-translocating decarboxylase subunit beta [Clostridia bacterium OttesenSCG-928-O13]
MSLGGVEILKMLVMWGIGGLLIYLAIAKDMEPSLLLPMGFGAILVNLPFSGAITQVIDGVTEEGPLSVLFDAGIANELFPLILFIGIGAMIDFGPLLKSPKLLLFGAAAQFGIFITVLLAASIGHFFPGTFSLQDAAAIGIIGAADGPTAIFVANYYGTKYMGAILVAAYSYMALVPIIQPPCIKLVTTKKERMMKMPYEAGEVSRTVRILFPIVVTVIAGLVAPRSVGLVGFLMFGNLIRECGVLESLSQTAQNALANLITIFLGITVAVKMQADMFLTWETLLIMGLGLFAFVFDTIGGVMFAKLLNLFTKNKVNPMIGACGISAFPMTSRVVHKMGLAEDPQNFLLMHAAGVNVGGQIASVIAGGLILGLVAR